MVGAWVLAQVADLVTDAFNSPDWVIQMIITLLVIGLPVSLLLSWAFDLTSDGLLRTGSGAGEGTLVVGSKSILALVAGLSAAGALTPTLMTPLTLFFTLNLVLFAFNLIPIHPLDGGKVLSWAFGARWEPVDEFLRRYGGIVLIVLVLSPIPILGYLLGPVLDLGQRAFAAVL